MLPIMKGNPTAEGHGLPYLVIKLKPGWRLDPESGDCLSSRDRRCALLSGLPSGVTVEAAVPALATNPAKNLSRDERQLARYLHVLFPRGERPAAYADILQRHPCVEEVILPAPATLP